MAFDAQVLAEGQIANSKGTLYTVPASTVLYLAQLVVFNTNAAEQTVIIYIKPGGTSRTWKRFVLDQNESAECLDGGNRIILEAGDLIEAQTTTASAVDYLLMGVEET